MASSSPVVSFNAGRAHRREGTNWVDPSPVKGRISVQPEDGLLHFFWVNRENNHVEEDLILFPGDASFVPVSEALGARTYVLKFSSSDQRLFFWMQDRDPVHDQENVTNLNNALNQAVEDDEPMESTSEHAEVHPTQSVAQAVTTTATTSSAAPASQASQNAASGTSPEELARFQALLQSFANSRGGGERTAFMEPDLSLGDVLTPTNLQPLFSNTTLIRTVFPSHPTDLPIPPSPDTVRRIVESPPFQASVRQLDQALATGMLQGLVVGLGLPASAGTGVGPFLKAIEEQAKKNPAPAQGDDREGGMDTS